MTMTSKAFIRLGAAACFVLRVSACLAEGDFALVRDGRAAVSVQVSGGDGIASVAADVEAFRTHVRAVTGASLPTNGVGAVHRLEIRIMPIRDINRRFEWTVEFPTDDRMLVSATSSSLMDALVRILEVGADARFLGSEPCMFQFEPRQDLLVPRQGMRSPKNGFSLNRDMYRVCGYKRELGFVKDGLFEYTHGISRYSFPTCLKGLPEGVAPLIKGKRLTKPAEPNNRWQPCYSNPETIRLATESVLRHLRKHPDQPSVTLGVNDNGGFCECDACKAADAGLRKPIFTNSRENRAVSYYVFVNAVAAAVAREFPKVRIGLLAYGETVMPPPFALADNVVPMMTLDTYSAAIDAKTAARHSAVIAEWGEKARTTGVWEYCWGRRFTLPRVDFAFQTRRMKELHAHGVRAYFGENSVIADTLDGPKLYLTSRLVKDIDADPESVLGEWFERFAGKAAEPFLRRLYARCENYWKSPAFAQTPLKAACGYVYMYPDPSHLYGVEPGFPTELRELAERVLAAAVTPGERARAELLVRHFEFLECEAAFLGAEWLEPESGELKDASQAAKMLADFNRRQPDLGRRWGRVCKAFSDPPFAEKDVYLRKEVLSRDPLPKIVQMLLKAVSFSDDVRLREELAKTAAGSAFGGLGAAVRRLLEPAISADPHRLTADANGSCTFRMTRDLPPGVWCARARVKAEDPRARAELFLWRQKGGRDKSWENARFVPLGAKGERAFGQICTVRPKDDGVNFIVNVDRLRPGTIVSVAEIDLFRLEDGEK